MCTRCEEFTRFTDTRFTHEVEGWCDVILLKDGKAVTCLESLTDSEKLEALRFLIAKMSAEIDYGKEIAYGEDL